MIGTASREYPETINNPLLLFQNAENCLRSRKVMQALALYQQAEQAGFEADACGGARWICQMLQGDFAAAWQESDVIHRRGKHDPNRFWSGAPLTGKRVLVRCLHGLGDTLQFVRYAPLLRRHTSHLTVEAQPLLKDLLAASDVADRVMTWGEAEPAYDEQIEMIELPRIFSTTLGNVPAQVPYLRVPVRGEEGIVTARKRARVGMVWASSQYNTARSMPLSLLERAMRSRPDLDFYSFQAEPERQELTACTLSITDVFDETREVVAAAQWLQRMDLVVTVDTMMAHLAGALAVPVWTMLPFEADWRWMLERSDTPWYPTMKLFRQPSPGDWDSVIERLIGALAQLPALPRHL